MERKTEKKENPPNKKIIGYNIVASFNQTSKEVKKMKRNGISFLVLVLLLAIVLITVLVFLPLIPGQEEGEWMVSPLQVEGNQVFLVGPDLTDLVEERLVYTYYSRGQWVSLEWMGYEDGVNVWLIPETLQSERPDWALNSNWTLDFLWPENGGSPPEGSFLGTSSE